MMAAESARNRIFRIAFGDYDLTVDRGSRTMSLVETISGTVWADGLSLGWIELMERATGAVTRHDFGACTLISLSEKAGAAGKRILFGLDAPGAVPVDVYLTCTKAEVQLTVEASRDSRTHRLHRIGLLPGLCAIPDDGASSLILPIGEGVGVRAADLAAIETAPRVWDGAAGLRMPFVGAVRAGAGALALLTDSAYGALQVARTESVGLSADWIYDRDPERRRLDLRIVPIPGGDAVAIARVYREKLIGDRNHGTLRKKARERPALAALLETGRLPDGAVAEPLALDGPNRWEAMDDALARIAGRVQNGGLALVAGADDWSAVAADAWQDDAADLPGGVSLPLAAAIYHDSVVRIAPAGSFLTALRALALLAHPTARERAVLEPLLLRTFAAFLTAHRFLTPDGRVEEARYSDHTRVVINRREFDAFRSDELVLPPGGFLVESGPFRAHDASRIGPVDYPTRAWRIETDGEGNQEFPI